MKRKNKCVKYNKYGYLFIIPFFTIFLIFQIYPMIYTVNLSFTDLFGWRKTYSYVGLDNYFALAKNELWWKAVYNTFFMWIINFIPQLLLAILFAVFFTNMRRKLRGAGAFKVMFYLPNIVTSATIALLFNQLFSHPYGVFDQMLTKMGIIDYEYRFLGNETSARLIISFIQTWKWFGSTMLIVISGILAINLTLYEAAKVDGATETVMFFKITLPLLKPIIAYVLVTSLVGGLQMFDIPFLFLDGGPNYSTETMATYIYKQAFSGNENYNTAAAGSVYLLVIALTLSRIVLKLMGGDGREKSLK